MTVIWQSVESSNINQIGYDAGTREVRVRFKSGTEYVYKDVPDTEFAFFLEADSKGKYLSEHFKGQYEYTKEG